MINHGRHCAWLIVASILCAASIPVTLFAADELTAAQKEEARSYFEKGSSAYQEGDYEQAIDWFRKSFELVRSPELVYNIGRCYEELGQTGEAVYHYEMYVRFYPTSEEADEARHRINMLREVDKRGAEASPSTAAQGVSGDGDETEVDPDAAAEGEAWYSDVTIFTGLRFAVGLSEPTDAPVMGLGIGGEFPVVDWLTAWAEVFFGGYLGEEKRGPLGSMNAPKNQVGLAFGLGTRWFASESFVWGVGAGFSIAGVSIEHDRLTWPAGEVLAYGTYLLSGGFGITLRLFGIFGPLYGHSAGDRGMEVGGLLGVSYTFAGGSEGEG